MIYYHGSTHKIDTFTLDYVGNGNDEAGAGIYLTNDIEIASKYSQNNGYIYILDINTDNISNLKENIPYQLIKELILESPNYLDILSNFGDIEYEGINSVLESAIESYNIDFYNAIILINNDFYKNHSKLFLEKIYEKSGISGYLRNFEEVKEGELVYNHIQHLVIYTPEVIEIKEIISIENFQMENNNYQKNFLILDELEEEYLDFER